MSVIKRSMMMYLSADKALGAVGGGLAAASLGFGVYMNIHGPAASFGHSKDFTVFAQLAGPRMPKDTAEPAIVPAPNDPLDMMATASIPSASHKPAPIGGAPDHDAATAIIPSVTIETASFDAATIFVHGRPRTVHIGDTVPDAGEVLAIRPGPRPIVKTSRGLILSSQQDDGSR